MILTLFTRGSRGGRGVSVGKKKNVQTLNYKQLEYLSRD